MVNRIWPIAVGGEADSIRWANILLNLAKICYSTVSIYSLYYVIKIVSKRKEVSNFPKPACALYQCPLTLFINYHRLQHYSFKPW